MCETGAEVTGDAGAVDGGVVTRCAGGAGDLVGGVPAPQGACCGVCRVGDSWLSRRARWLATSAAADERLRAWRCSCRPRPDLHHRSRALVGFAGQIARSIGAKLTTTGQRRGPQPPPRLACGAVRVVGSCEVSASAHGDASDPRKTEGTDAEDGLAAA
jgi:hypothetical protein